ncbi:MAG: tryptophan synthase subunit alpha [Candidatus Woesearchaeota archaeon]
MKEGNSHDNVHEAVSKNVFRKCIFMPFLVLGDPDYESSFELVKTLIENKADGLELGFAFSDPIADGPAVQKANRRALERGMTTEKAFLLIERIRSISSIPLSVMVSFNIVFNYGVDKFYSRCRIAGVDAVLCPEIPPEEAGEIAGYADKHEISQVFMVSPVTSERRIRRIDNLCNGYIYLVSIFGTTGARKDLSADLRPLIDRTKRNTSLPVYVGFGVSKPDHVSGVLNAGADGVICGSRFCEIIEKNTRLEEKILKIAGLCRRMADALPKNI